MERIIKIFHTEKYDNHTVCRGTLILIQKDLLPEIGGIGKDKKINNLIIYSNKYQDERLDYEMILPYIVSEPEDIEDGEMCLYSNGDGTGKMKQWIAPFVKNNAGAKYKILAFPENFDQKILQLIVDGELKDGIAVKIECEYLDKGWDEKRVTNRIYTPKLTDNHINILAYQYGTFVVGMEDLVEEGLHDLKEGIKDCLRGALGTGFEGASNEIVKWLKENYNLTKKQ